MNRSLSEVRLPNPARQVVRVPRIGPARLEAEYLSQSIPVIITEATRDWPALTRWNLDYLRETVGATRVPVRGNRYRMRLLGHCTVAEYADWLLGRSAHAFLDENRAFAPYVAHSRSLGEQLASDVNFSGFLQSDYVLRPPTLWIGPRHAETPLHFDRFGVVVYAQIFGHKQVLLFPPQQAHSLYVSDYFEFTTHYSRINLDQIDYAKFPRFAQAQPWAATLGPGDVLVFGRKMWHEFRALDSGISVTMHAGRPSEYSDWNPELMKERTRQALHWFGAYMRRDCACHAIPSISDWQGCIDNASNALQPPRWLAAYPRLKALAMWIARRNLHERGLSDTVGWNPPDTRSANSSGLVF